MSKENKPLNVNEHITFECQADWIKSCLGISYNSSLSGTANLPQWKRALDHKNKCWYKLLAVFVDLLIEIKIWFSKSGNGFL